MHYNRARLAGKLDEVVPPSQAPCEHCGGPVVARRWGARFCSTSCKQDAADAAARERTLARHMARVKECAWCRDPLPIGKRANARFCSVECGTKWHNQQKALVQKRATVATREPCPVCAEPVPASRPRGALYCSKVCKDSADHSMSPEASRRRKDDILRYLYGLSVEDYQARLDAQGGVCAVCGTDKPGGKGAFHVDHCHTGGHVRGLLCHHCNLGLGNFKDDPERLRRAAAYLEAAVKE